MPWVFDWIFSYRDKVYTHNERRQVRLYNIKNESEWMRRSLTDYNLPSGAESSLASDKVSCKAICCKNVSHRR